MHAAGEAGHEPQVRIEARTRAGTAVLTIDDNGPGVAADARERIFDPYMTTKEHGTGLGLAIVRKIVLDHGGDVHVSDQPSPLGGARMEVTLPTAPARA
ncbi:MAG TPA: HAMP domain-containing sensor histidine kinase [Polyangia bacterium]|nr:HAMP domain-containing sensor histidine kinase [Polyangia bacterium]